MNRPVAVILAGQAVEGDLASVLEIRETASLMIAGSMLIEHVLNELQDLGFSQCIVLANNNAKDIHELVNGSKYWGIDIEVVNYLLNKPQLLREFKSMSRPHGLLLIEANALRSESIDSFLSQCESVNYPLCEAYASGQSLGLSYLKPTNKVGLVPKPIELAKVIQNRLRSVRDFHEANVDVITGRFRGIETSVGADPKKNHRRTSLNSKRFYCHWSAEVDKQSQLNQAVMIERRCKVEKNVSLMRVVLNHHVYVAKNTVLNDTVVMPNAIIPANLRIENAIVVGKKVYSIYD